MNVILLIGFLDGLLPVPSVMLYVTFLLEKSRRRMWQMAVASKRRRGGPWQTERQVRTARSQASAAQRQSGKNRAMWRRRLPFAARARLRLPHRRRAAPAAPQVPATRLDLADRARGAGHKRKAGQQLKAVKFVSGPALRGTAGQRSRRVILRLRPLLEGQDMTLGERMQRLRPSTTRSQCNLLKPATHAKFVLALEKFLAHWLLKQLPDWSAATWDAALQDHVELLFEGDKDRSAAACLTSAVLWLAPEFGQPRTDALPWTIASLRGWARLEPGFSRPPLPYAVMMSIVSWLAMHRQWQAGLLTWMLFETYLRVNEALTMHSQDIVRAAPLVTREPPVVKVMACSSSQLLATKTGEQVYVSLPLDLARQRPLALLLCRWAGLRRRDTQLWDLTYPQLRDAFQQAAVAVGVEELGASLLSLRPGGAIHDRGCNARSLLNVQLRGGWRSSSTLQRLEECSLLAKKVPAVQAANLAAETLLHSSERFFEPLFGEFRADTALSSSSSQAEGASVQPFAERGEHASSSTSATASTLTSPTQQS